MSARGVTASWHNAARLLAGQRAILDDRPAGEQVPPSLAARAWSTFLLSLADDELAALEIGGIDATWPERTPASLTAMISEARAVCALPSLGPVDVPAAPRRARQHERPRKQAQIDAFAQLILPTAKRARRVLDIGSGHGHLTRELAERLALPVVGLERDVTLAARARTLAAGGAARAPSFSVTDVLRDGVPFAQGDCVIGLHACGELGDALVTAAADAAIAAVALVGCCLQKQRAPSRRPLCTSDDSDVDDVALALPKQLLGLSNLTPRDDGVEASLADNLAARERRLALHRLLEQAGLPLHFGAEIEGLNRRAAHLALPTLVVRAFAARGLATPSRADIDEAAAWARERHARSRRLSLPRSMLARVLEVFVLLDRARFLAEHGFHVEVGVAFPASVSARNLALIAVARGR